MSPETLAPPSEHSEAPGYVPSSTVEQFIAGAAEGPAGELRLLILMGPRGEGKTSGAIIACLELAERMRRTGHGWALPLRVAVVRDTFTNLERTTVVSFEENRQKGLPLEWRDGHREAVVTFDVPFVHFYLFGLDQPSDADKLQGFACGVLWLEEVAPAAGLATGIPPDVLGLGATSLRQAGVPPRILLTLNPPDEDSWVFKIEQELEQRGLSHLRVHRFEIPPGEKSEHFRRLAQEAGAADEAAAWQMAAEDFDRYRERNQAFLESIGRPDLVARLVRGQVGGVQLGEAVVPNFSEEHVAKEPLNVYRSLPLVRCWDNEPSPACALFQVLPAGAGVNIIGSHALDNTHMEGFINAWLLPFMRKYNLMPEQGTLGPGRGRRYGFAYEDVGDPVLLNAQLSAGRVIMQALGTTLIPGAVEWEERRAAALAAFERGAPRGGRRFVLIDPTENDLLIKGLRNRFRFPRSSATGVATMNVTAAKKASGIYGQPPDALFYGLAWKFPAADWLRRHQAQPAPRTRAQPRTYLGA